LILSAMVLPYMVSIMRDVFETVPPQLRESAYGLGATTWEVVGSVVLPFSRVGVIGAFMLALGRALGETMAVTFVVGNSYHIMKSILEPGATISASLANEFAEAEGLQLSSLLALGFLLFVLTFSVIGFARLMLLRLQKRYG
jgi:phosphate transport system permease protein